MSVFSELFRKLVILCSITALFLLVAAPVFTANNQSTVLASQSSKVQKHRRDTVHIKLAEGISLKNSQFVGTPSNEVSTLNNVLNQANATKINKLVNASGKNQAQKKLETNLGGYYVITFKQDIDVVALTTYLKQLSIVATAYAAPLPAPAPAKPVQDSSASFVSMQNYRQPAPQGIDSLYAATFPGGTGQNTKIIDIEYSWNTSHQDLSKAGAALIPNGTPIDPFNNTNHGTAVLGEIVADNNSYGVTGLVPASSLGLINAYNAERGYDLVGALQLAALHTSPGDVIIIEQQTWGPTAEANDFVPVEWIPEVYDAIRALTASGISVIEPAGNGAQNLDNTSVYGSTFPMGKQDSGAIIVGAAHNCSGTSRLSRMAYSTYGSRVNMQGPGECVTTTGYGSLASTGGSNYYYTNAFSGTSAATPVVAGAAAALNSAYEALNGTAIAPEQLRAILMTTATPQSSLATGNIGGYPNLAKALLHTDNKAPAAPTNLKTVPVTKRTVSINLSWNASMDNVKVTNYRIYRNGLLIATTNGVSTSYADAQVIKGQTYLYTIVALDGSGNTSASSNSASVTL